MRLRLESAGSSTSTAAPASPLAVGSVCRRAATRGAAAAGAPAEPAGAVESAAEQPSRVRAVAVSQPAESQVFIVGILGNGVAAEHPARRPGDFRDSDDPIGGPGLQEIFQVSCKMESLFVISGSATHARWYSRSSG